MGWYYRLTMIPTNLCQRQEDYTKSNRLQPRLRRRRRASQVVPQLATGGLLLKYVWVRVSLTYVRPLLLTYFTTKRVIYSLNHTTITKHARSEANRGGCLFIGFI